MVMKHSPYADHSSSHFPCSTPGSGSCPQSFIAQPSLFSRTTVPVALSCAVVPPLGTDTLVEKALPRSAGRPSHRSGRPGSRLVSNPCRLAMVSASNPATDDTRPWRTTPTSICWTRPGRQRPARSHGRSCHGCGLCQLLVCADAAPVFPTGETDRRGCRGLPPLSNRLQPLRRCRRIRRGSSADLVCDRRLLRDDEQVDVITAWFPFVTPTPF
jgi:NAD-dependent dihydropyrimidine dehydrogenase PreA subunit